jgi:hypothetical protein
LFEHLNAPSPSVLLLCGEEGDSQTFGRQRRQYEFPRRKFSECGKWIEHKNISNGHFFVSLDFWRERKIFIAIRLPVRPPSQQLLNQHRLRHLRYHHHQHSLHSIDKIGAAR